MSSRFEGARAEVTIKYPPNRPAKPLPRTKIATASSNGADLLELSGLQEDKEVAVRSPLDSDVWAPGDEMGSVQELHQEKMKNQNGLRNSSPSLHHNYGDMDPNPEYDPDKEIVPIELPDLDPETLSRDLVNHLGEALSLSDEQRAKAEDVMMLWLERRFSEALKAGAVRSINQALLVSRTPRTDLHDKQKYQGVRIDGDPEKFLRTHYSREIDNKTIHSGHIYSHDRKLYNSLEYIRKSNKNKDGSMPDWSIFGIQSSDDFNKELTESVKSFFGESFSLSDIKLFFGRMSRSLQEGLALGR